LLGESTDAYLLHFSSLDHVFHSSNQTKTPQLPICSPCAVQKKRAMFILGLIVAWCHVLADGCDKEWTLLEYHP